MLKVLFGGLRVLGEWLMDNVHRFQNITAATQLWSGEVIVRLQRLAVRCTCLVIS
jgi:hypothetical protein